jgi:hypothetical protein
MDLDDTIFWPNGKGFTPCTKAYADKKAERDAIKNKPDYDDIRGADGWVSMDDLTPDDYEAWNRLDNELGSMQIAGHLGQGEAW